MTSAAQPGVHLPDQQFRRLESGDAAAVGVGEPHRVARGRADVEGVGELHPGDAVRFTDTDGRVR
ncbi:hypothetical protein JHV675_52700 [Mycobacterium avium subsp. hominissuis]